VRFLAASTFRLVLFAFHSFLLAFVYRHYRIAQASWTGLELAIFICYFYMLFLLTGHMVGSMRAVSVCLLVRCIRLVTYLTYIGFLFVAYFI